MHYMYRWFSQISERRVIVRVDFRKENVDFRKENVNIRKEICWRSLGTVGFRLSRVQSGMASLVRILSVLASLFPCRVRFLMCMGAGRRRRRQRPRPRQRPRRAEGAQDDGDLPIPPNATVPPPPLRSRRGHAPTTSPLGSRRRGWRRWA